MIESNQADERSKGTESTDALLVREWDSDEFHRRVAELEAQGYAFEESSYKVIAEMNPESGEISHLHCIEMRKP